VQCPKARGGRPQSKTEYNARGLGCRVRADVGANRGAGRRTDGRHPARVALCHVLGRLVHRIGVAGGDQRECAERVDLRDRNFIGHTPQVGRHPVGKGRPDPRSHLDVIAMNRNPAVRVDFDRSQRAVRSAPIILGDASHPRSDDDARLLSTPFLLGALLPDRMFLQLIENLRRADRHFVRISRDGPSAGLERVTSPELDLINRQSRSYFVNQHLERRHCLQCSIPAHRPGSHAA